MRTGRRYVMMGPTSAANVVFGVQPVGMKSMVIRPQAMNAPMLGMIMPARYPPNFCTRARTPGPSRFLLTRASGSTADIGTLSQTAVSRALSTTKPVSYTHLRAHETRHDLVCRLLLEKKK